MTHSCLSISIVTYKPDPQQFAEALRSLNQAIVALQAAQSCAVTLTLIDNGDQAAAMQESLAQVPAARGTLVAPGANVGYGRGHNLAIEAADSDYHLIMNPDVILDELALIAGLHGLAHDQQVVAVSPEATDGAGNTLYLCKTFPSVIDLGLRGFAPGFLKRLFTTRLAAYENRALVDKGERAPVDLISGCFMLCRTAALQKAGGFNNAFFLYFEDFALSVELAKYGALLYLPSCKIIHFGGDAGKKGLRHIGYFVASAFRFFRLYGWKFV